MVAVHCFDFAAEVVEVEELPVLLEKEVAAVALHLEPVEELFFEAVEAEKFVRVETEVEAAGLLLYLEAWAQVLHPELVVAEAAA